MPGVHVHVTAHLETSQRADTKTAAARCSTQLLDGEDSLHARGGMTRNSAEIRVLALLEDDLQRLRRAGGDERGLLAVDLEVVSDVALVLDDERHGASR